MSIDPDIKEEFARQMQKNYQESTMLPDVSNVRKYTKSDRDLEFVQLGKRIPIPVNVFNQRVLEPTTSQFARNIATGEENFFLTDLINAADDKTIPSTDMDKLSIDAVEEAVTQLGGADTIFIPYADQYTKIVNDWLKNGESLSGGTQLEVAGSTLDIRRVVPKFGIKDVLVTNSSKIDLVQKRSEDTTLPKGMDVDESMVDINQNQKFMVYFARDTEPGDPEDEFEEYLDVIFRVVLSQPLPSEEGAIRLEAPPDLQLSRSED